MGHRLKKWSESEQWPFGEIAMKIKIFSSYCFWHQTKIWKYLYSIVIVESIKDRNVLFIFTDYDATWTFDVHFVSVLIMFLYPNSVFSGSSYHLNNSKSYPLILFLLPRKLQNSLMQKIYSSAIKGVVNSANGL